MMSAFTTFSIEFEGGAAAADGIAGARAACFAATRVLVGDAASNCSAAVDRDSYLPVLIQGRPAELAAVSLRVATPAPTHDPAMWTEPTRAAVDAALRAAGFYAASPPTARVSRLEYDRADHTLAWVALVVSFGFACLFAWIAVERRRAWGAYARVPPGV